jgi:Protein of unknown function DUF262/HNH endonuclease
MVSPVLQYEPMTKSVQDFLNYFERDQLHLDPPFQRKPVWTNRDREKLIDSIVNGFPVPSVYLHEREENGQIVYDVIDGKQRIETLLMFMGKLWGRGRFSARVLWPNATEREDITWRDLSRRKVTHALLSYRIPTHIVRGPPAEVIELFVRINSTGKALTRAEQSHARYNTSPFLKGAESLARSFEGKLLKTGVLSEGQISRMKHVELMCELMLVANRGAVQNKKAAIDGLMRSKEITARQVKQAKTSTSRAIKWTLKRFPSLKSSRFRHLSDFYSLVALIQHFEAEKLILGNKKSNRLAAEILTSLATGVDSLREKVRRFETPGPDELLYRDYAKTVAEGTDALRQRQERERILRALIEPLFQRKDAKRGFTPEQRRILWGKTDERRCVTCKKILTWDDFTIDHINPHSKGGRTALKNAALMCRSHNSSKGNRRRAS